MQRIKDEKEIVYASVCVRLMECLLEYDAASSVFLFLTRENFTCGGESLVGKLWVFNSVLDIVLSRSSSVHWRAIEPVERKVFPAHSKSRRKDKWGQQGP